MKIIFEPNPSKSDIDFLTQKINEETKEHGQATPFRFFIKDEDKNIIAGANGFIIYGAIYTDQLWVSSEHRKKGLARRIMEQVHDYGKHHNCNIATLQTMDFQGAVKFYEKLGYKQDFKQTGYVDNSCIIYMKKSLL